TSPEAVEKIRSAIKARVGVQTEILNYHKDGTPLWIELEIQPVLSEEGELTNFVAFQKDITARKEYEERLQIARDVAESAAQTAAEANQAKSRFVANMSHEIRTPLHGVLGMAELLRSTSLDEDQRQFVDSICRSGQALLSLINDVLDFSKIEAGRLDIEAMPYHIADVVDETLDTLRLVAQDKGLELSSAVSSAPTLIGDQGRLRQILLNLVANAVKFTKKGRVNVSVSVEVIASEAQVEVVVEDTGIGMAPAVVERLFQPFMQADVSTTRRFGGTGLGLSICHRLVQLMEGEIGVTSAEGVGSRFWFRLQQPIAPATQSMVESGAPKTAQLDLVGCRVLLVEDNPTNQLIAKRMLLRLGCEVEVAVDGEEAVAAV
ncbi:MAG: ATP-binding protein, partial [Myxococcota bacterium]